MVTTADRRGFTVVPMNPVVTAERRSSGLNSQDDRLTFVPTASDKSRWQPLDRILINDFAPEHHIVINVVGQNHGN